VRIGVTGHTNLTPPTHSVVAQAIRDILPHEGLIGVSCAAPGADTIFAEIVLDRGGILEVVLPGHAYRNLFGSSDAARLDALCRAAAQVTTLDGPGLAPVEFARANDILLDRCDRLLAVWDGSEPVDSGGTGEVVRRARARDIPVEVVWPPGAARVP
jgi:hypothetical protein